MSAHGLSPAHSSPASPYNGSPKETPSTPVVGKTTRTVAIIKPHALDHRFDIEQRISEAGFEVRGLSLSRPPFDESHGASFK